MTIHIHGRLFASTALLFLVALTAACGGGGNTRVASPEVIIPDPDPEVVIYRPEIEMTTSMVQDSASKAHCYSISE